MTVYQFSLRLPGGVRETAETRFAHKPWEVEDGLWARIEPLLPVVVRRYRHPGRKRLDDRKVPRGILSVLCTGIRWEIRDDIHEAFLTLGCAIIRWRRLKSSL
jgi:hypothetical protein